MKKTKRFIIIFSLIFLSFIICCTIIIVIKNKRSKNQSIICEVKVKSIDDLIIGSEPPKLLYADNNKVIFDYNL